MHVAQTKELLYVLIPKEMAEEFIFWRKLLLYWGENFLMAFWLCKTKAQLKSSENISLWVRSSSDFSQFFTSSGEDPRARSLGH